MLVTAMAAATAWCIAAGSAAAQSTAGATSARGGADAGAAQEISTLIREMHVVSEKASGNVDVIGKYFDPDVTIVYFNNYTKNWQQYKEMDQKGKAAAPASYEGTTATHTIGEINIKIRGNVAWAVYPYAATTKSKDQESTVAGIATMVLTKDTGKWLISHYQIAGQTRRPTATAQAPTTSAAQPH
jgi:ketosteroid isomerase-like protein